MAQSRWLNRDISNGSPHQAGKVVRGVSPAAEECSAIGLQRGDEAFLRIIDLAEPPHLAFFLMLQEFAIARDVAAIDFAVTSLRSTPTVSRAVTCR